MPAVQKCKQDLKVETKMRLLVFIIGDRDLPNFTQLLSPCQTLLSCRNFPRDETEML